MKNFEEVAASEDLTEDQTIRFCAYMRSRWPLEESRMSKDGYAKEWATRFHQGYEYAASDSFGKMVLDNLALK
jgi:hypothetical protein